MTREELIKAAREGRLEVGGPPEFFVDGAKISYDDAVIVGTLFEQHVFTLDHDDIDSMAPRIPVYVRES